jgi:ribosomal-protein-alanine N-acetyltransferase
MIRTERLLLRPWRDEDIAPFAAMNADPAVMRYFGATRDRAESEAAVQRIRAHHARHGFGLWAVELPGQAGFIGQIGLVQVPEALPCAPAVEVGWRLAQPFWGRGYATEAARASLADGFTRCGLAEIVSFTAVPNAPSRAVMQKLGMTRDPAGDFDHPALPEGHALRRHVLYRLHRHTWSGEK